MKKSPGKYVRDFLTTLIFVVGVAGLVWYVSKNLDARQAGANPDATTVVSNDTTAPDAVTVAAPAESLAQTLTFTGASDSKSAGKDPGKDSAKAPAADKSAATSTTAAPAAPATPASGTSAAKPSAPAASATPGAAPSDSKGGAASSKPTVSTTPTTSAMSPAEFFAQLALHRDQTRGMEEDSLRQLLASKGVDDDTRKSVNAKLLWLSQSAAREKQAEDIIQAQGIRPVVVNLFEPDKATVLVGMTQITENQAEMIGGTVARVAGISQDNISIVLQNTNGTSGS